MRFNDKDMIDICKRPSQIEGRLQHRGPAGTFRETGQQISLFKKERVRHIQHQLKTNYIDL
jgi:hypothetical protein